MSSITVKDLIKKLEQLPNVDDIVFIRTTLETSSVAGTTNITAELCVEHYKGIIEDEDLELEYLTIMSEVY